MAGRKQNPETVAEARRLWALGIRQKEIGEALGVHKNTIYKWSVKHKWNESELDPDHLYKNKKKTDGSSCSSAPSSDSSPSGDVLRDLAGGSSRASELIAQQSTRNRISKGNLDRVNRIRHNLDMLSKRPDFGASPGQSRASAAKALIEAIEALQRVELAAHGLDEGAPADGLKVIEVPEGASLEAWQGRQAVKIAGSVRRNEED